MTMNELPKVRFRAMEPEDLDVLYRIENDTSLWGVGVTNVPYSRYMLHDYIANASGDIYADKQVRMMIDDETGRSVGIVDITDFEPRHLRAELGIVVQCSERRRGFAAAAIERVKVYARDVLHLHQLYVYIDSHNEAALSLFRKCGFGGCVELKDWLFDGENYRNAVLMQYFL